MSENNHDHLSNGDAFFLYLERAGQPINVAALCVCEGSISLEDCIASVESKLPLTPRYRQRVVAPPFNIGLPSWEYDQQFNIRNHVREVKLERGTDAELKATAAGILGDKLDRSRPLWDITLLRGLKGNRTGVIVRFHHCLADGISGVGLLNVLMDPSPMAPLPAHQEQRFHALPAGRAMTSLLGNLVHSCFSTFSRLVTAESELLDVAQLVIAAAKPSQQADTTGFNSGGRIPTLDQLRRLMPELLAPTERLPFNVVCYGPHKFHSAELPVAQMRAAKRACGATLNDVVLALVTSAIRRYAELHGVPVKGRLLRIIVPVSVRGKGDVTDLGNRITFLPLTIPLDIRNPIELIAAIRERLAFLKNVHVAELVSLAGTLLGTIPPPAQALAGPIASQLPLSLCNTICTNVPGPKVPLYLIGHRMLACYPYVATSSDLGMNCAILTYNGTAYFGFTGDVHAMPDVERLGKFLRMSFAELRKAVAIRAARSDRARSIPARRASRVR
jgi:diacylglycerol O-acyltransferase